MMVMTVILTEGIIKGIAEGNPSKIVQGSVKTPLIWGIQIVDRSGFIMVEDLKGNMLCH